MFDTNCQASAPLRAPRTGCAMGFAAAHPSQREPRAKDLPSAPVRGLPGRPARGLAGTGGIFRFSR
ncbi:hypothetical protein [Desulfocurvus sp. DL9XJH121]